MKETRISDAIASTSKMTRNLMAMPGSSGRSRQLHADAPDGVEVPGLLGVLAELAPQPGDVHVHGLVSAAIRHPPHVSEELSLGDYLAGSNCQGIKKLEFSPGQVELAAVEGGL